VAGTLAGILLVLATLGVDNIDATRITAVAAIVVAAGVILWAVLRTRRQRRVHEESLTAWAAERAQREERLRIARELHDLASHGLGLITVRASVARRLTGPGAEAERERALADIEQAGRAATTELRRMLSVLRSDPSSVVPRPQPGVADLPALVATAERAGLTVEVDLSGTADLDAATQAAIHAIVAESLTNVARHAGPTAVRVETRRDRTAGGELLILSILDQGAAPGWRSHPGAGHGVAGMRERAAVLGGSLRVAMAGSGHLVEARLPLVDAG